jgi:hypothetical protein
VNVYVITQGHDSSYVSVWSSPESAQREVDRLNDEYSHKYHGRRPFDWEEDDLND